MKESNTASHHIAAGAAQGERQRSVATRDKRVQKNLGKLQAFIEANGLQPRRPNGRYDAWLSLVRTAEPLRSFFRTYTPSGERMAGAVTLLGYPAIMEIDELYGTSRLGRVIVFAQTGDGSYVGVNADTGNVGWLMSGHLCPEDIPAGWVEFPGAIGDFLFGAETDGNFPIDPGATRHRNL